MLYTYKYNTATGQYDAYSQGLGTTGDQSNPILTNHEGTEGKTVTQKIFLHNNDALKYYTTIVITFTPTNLVEAGNARNFLYKLIKGDTEPTEAQWDGIVTGNSITMDNIGSAGTPDDNFYPFWFRLVVPPRATVSTVTDVSIKITAEEFAV